MITERLHKAGDHDKPDEMGKAALCKNHHPFLVLLLFSVTTSLAEEAPPNSHTSTAPDDEVE